MRKIVYLIALIGVMGLNACNEEFGTVTITFTKATPIYGDLAEIRQTPLKGEISSIVNPGKIFVSENKLLVGEENKGIHVIDNSNPENPVNISFINIPGNKEFYVQGNHIYAESYYDMVKIDISNINEPVLVSRVEDAFNASNFDNNGQALIGFNFEKVSYEPGEDERYDDIVLANQVNYFNYRDQIIPPSNVPASFAGNSQQAIGSVNRIAYNDGYVYVISRSFLTSFSDNGTLELQSSFSLAWEMETIFPHDNKLFVGTMSSMEVLDLSDPANPSNIYTFWHAVSCDPVLPVDDVAYLTLRSGGTNCPGDDNLLFALDITDASNATIAQQITMDSPFGMTMIGDKLYVGEGENGIKIFDATDRRNLVLETSDRSIKAYDVLAHPTRADLLLIAGPNGLDQYKIEVDERVLLSSLSF